MRFRLMMLAVTLFFNVNLLAQENQEKWSSMKTLSVPYDVRIKEFDKGNLAPNFSFENGELQKNDSLIKNFQLKSWNKVGNNVEWVNTDNKSYKNDEASTGKYAIKIHREFADVQEINNKPDGVVSDFIEVIPGNYYFGLDIRLDRVFPAVNRLSSKLSDNIDIRLTFYDKDKKQLSNGIYYYYYDKDVDNSFKGFAFSNFYYINKFDWGHVRARTYNYPFSEGDLPDGCKYVKLHIGLLGRGTMYVDNVVFKYSKWNFTSLEKVAPFFEKDYSLTDLVIPKPKKLVAGEISNLKNTKILIPDNPTVQDVSASKLLMEKLGKKAILVKEKDYKPNAKSELVFSIGNTKLFQKNQSQLKLDEISGKDEGYIIQKIGNTVYLKGFSEKGSYLAVTTVIQLIDSDKNKYHHAEIVDFPDFDGRSYLFANYDNEWTLKKDTSLSAEDIKNKLAENNEKLQIELQNIEYYSKLKLNKIYNNYGQLSKKWYEPGDFFFKLFEEAGKKCQEIGTINTCVMLNPYYHFDYESQISLIPDSLLKIFDHSSEGSFKKITNVLDKCIKNFGATTFMICADDFVPHAGTTRGQYALFTEKDKQKYPNIAAAQSDMMTKLMARYGKKVRAEFCPAPYLNEFIDYGMGSAEAFFRDLTANTPKEMAIIWTGNTVRSLSYDMADIKRYSDIIGQKPMIWDNTPYARELTGNYGGYPAIYPGKSVMCSLFEPYDIVYPKDFFKYLDNHFYINGSGFTARYMIKYATFADFAWNSNDYDADFSLYKILIQRFGKIGAMDLLQFNDNYFKLVAIWAEINNAKSIGKDKAVFKVSEKMENEAQSYIKNMAAILKKMQKTVNDNRLLEELQKEKENIEKKYNTIKKEGNRGEKKRGHRQT